MAILYLNNEGVIVQSAVECTPTTTNYYTDNWTDISSENGNHKPDWTNINEKFLNKQKCCWIEGKF